MGFRGRSIVTTWSMAAGDKASCYPASMLIVTASWAYGATVTAAAASAEDGLVATVSGARGESATTSQARRYCRTVPDGRVVPGVRAHNDGVWARGDSCDDAPEAAVIAAASGEQGRPRGRSKVWDWGLVIR